MRKKKRKKKSDADLEVRNTGLEVIKLEFILKLKIKCIDWLHGIIKGNHKMQQHGSEYFARRPPPPPPPLPLDHCFSTGELACHFLVLCRGQEKTPR